MYFRPLFVIRYTAIESPLAMKVCKVDLREMDKYDDDLKVASYIVSIFAG